MTIRELITKLMDEDFNLDDHVEIYVCSKTDVIKEYVEQAGGDTWCLDEILEIDEIEDRGGHIWLKAEEIE